MTASLKYAIVGIGAVAFGVLVLWPFLDPAGRRGVVIAALVALPVQILSFATLLHFRGRVNGFLAAWVGGTVLRMGAILAVAFFVIRSGAAGMAPMLLALVVFFFGLLLLEPIYFKSAHRETG